MIKKNQNTIEVDSDTFGYTQIGKTKVSGRGYASVRKAQAAGLSYITATGANSLIRYNRPILLAQSRDFMRNNGIYNGMINRAVNYIIGTGFTLQSTSKQSRKIERAFRNWWRRPDIRGVLVGPKFAQLLCREILTCGDVGCIKTNKSLLQLIESEQIAGDSLMDNGIKTDEYGTPTSYWVSPYRKLGGLNRGAKKKIDAKNFIYVADFDRPSATRAVPPCQSAFAMLHRINDVCDSEAIAWQTLARMAIAITREEAPQRGYAASEEDDATDADDLSTRITDLGYALIFHGKHGEKVEGIRRNIPGQNFSESLRTFLRLIGLPLGLPLEIVMLDWTKSNYSQSRAVLEQAHQTFICWQTLIEEVFYRDVFRWKVDQFIKSGLVKQTKDVYDHNWIKPTFPWIDQLKEAKAQAVKLDRGLTTHSMVCKTLNTDGDEVLDKREAEIKSAIERAKKIEAATSEKVPWQILAGLEVKSAPSAEENIQSTVEETIESKEDEKEGNKKND